MNKWQNINATYLYDNSFEGLLNVIRKVVITKEIPQQITTEDYYTPDLFSDSLYIENSDPCLTLIKLLKQNREVYYNVYLTFFSNNTNKEMIILKYILYYLKYGSKLLDMKHLKVVISLNKLSKNVAYECHKFKGFLRFTELDNNILFAEFEPNNDVIFLIFNHFKDRLKNEHFIINDVSRNKAILYDKCSTTLIDSSTINRKAIIESQNEELYKSMWKSFFKTIAIKDRTNKKCQMTFMPKRFWKHLTEMENDNE